MPTTFSASRGVSTPLFAGTTLGVLLALGAWAWWWAETSTAQSNPQTSAPTSTKSSGAAASKGTGTVAGQAASGPKSTSGLAPALNSAQATPNVKDGPKTAGTPTAQASEPDSPPSLTAEQVARQAALLQAASQTTANVSEQQAGRVDLRRKQRKPAQNHAGSPGPAGQPLTVADTGLPALPAASLLQDQSVRSRSALGDAVVVTLSSAASLDEVREFYLSQWPEQPGSTAQVSLLVDDGEQLDLRMVDPSRQLVQRVHAVAVPGGVWVQLSRAGGR
jgi:cytoskeletal protein RodZ